MPSSRPLHGPTYLGGRPLSRACALCGRPGGLTRAHVPPQAAGNTGEVRRYRPGISKGTLGPQGMPQKGGLFIESLCRDCNSWAGARYDGAYSDFAHRLEFATNSAALFLPRDVPPVSLAPGLVSRSILIGLMAVNPRIRVNYPMLADQLLDEDPEIRLPGGLELRMALTAQRTARLAAAPSIMKVLDRRLFHLALAEVWFRPLAWALVPTPGHTPELGPDLVVAHGWTDATDWLRYSTARTSVDLRNIVKSLPLVRHPRADPIDRDNWVEMLSDEAPLLEGYLPA